MDECIYQILVFFQNQKLPEPRRVVSKIPLRKNSKNKRASVNTKFDLTSAVSIKKPNSLNIKDYLICISNITLNFGRIQYNI